MSERERWIVYPLLFLALGVALRDELFDQTWSRNVVCERLTLVDSQNGSPLQQLRIGTLGKVEQQGIAPGGELRVGVIQADTVRAGTIVADRIASGPPKSTLLNLLRSLTKSAQAAQEQPSVDPNAETGSDTESTTPPVETPPITAPSNVEQSAAPPQETAGTNAPTDG